jgi:CheY-like chemotaxis protein
MVIASTQIPSKPIRPLRVLVVDGNPDSGRAVVEYFKWKGHDARAPGTAREALKFAPQFSPELVLVDLDISDVPGPEIGEQIRNNQNASAAVITGLSVSESLYLRRRCAEVGFDYFLTHPVAANEYDYLLSAADNKSHITETFFNRKREHDAQFYGFVIAQLDFGHLILDYAQKHYDTDGVTMQRSLERADRIGDLATIWLGRATSLSYDQTTRVFAITGALRRRVAEMRDGRSF